MIRLQTDHDVLLVDVSYYIIYRYHALHRWFQMSDTPYDALTFLDKYKQLFVSNLLKMVKKLKVKMPSNVVLVGDCSRKTIWRMELCPTYKASRDDYWEKHPIKEEIFPAIHQELIPSLIEEKGFQYACVDRLEADDIVYCVKRQLQENGFEKRLLIITNDNDYLQLAAANVDILNLPAFKSITSRQTGCPRRDLLAKVLGGDPSDNIPRVVTKAKVTRYLKSEEADVTEEGVRAFVQAHKGDMAQYELNRTLICMEMIPEELQRTVLIELLK